MAPRVRRSDRVKQSSYPRQSQPSRRWPQVTAATSAAMRGNRATNTRPELVVRRLLWGLGYRYRTHLTTLPGRPDIVFLARRCAIFVHGCFWHRHAGCPKASMPRKHIEYWGPKFERNVQRDTDNVANLRALGWRCLIVWECELSKQNFARRLITFLGPKRWSR
jgi:DNA mismatch endonuclease, patch repair protein